MRHVRIALTIFTAAWFLALGTGVVEYAHNAQHAQLAHEDVHHAGHAGHAHSDEAPPPVHDETNCQFHAQLNSPMIATPALVLLICVGLLIAFLSDLPRSPVTVRIPSRIDCRGPPVAC
jgi:hypothetical protein